METPVQIAAKKLSWHLETQSSIEVEVKTTITAFGENAKRSPDFKSTIDHYIETASGQRFLDFRGVNSGEVIIRSTHYGDLGKFTDVNYVPKNAENQKSVYITNHFFMENAGDRRQIPSPLLYLYVGRKPLHLALPEAEYVGTDDCMGRPCDAFLFKQVPWTVPQDQVFHLDKETAIPLKVEAFRDQKSRDEKRPLSVWSAKSLDTVQGYHIPLKSYMNAYDKDGGLAFTWDFEVDKIKYNETYPASTFQPVIQPGVVVLDGVANKSYQTPGAVTPPPAAATAADAGRAIQATPPFDWSSTLSTGGLILGAALIVAGGFAMWRRR